MAHRYNDGVESDAMKDLRRRREALDERNSKLTIEEIWEYERRAEERFYAGSGIQLIDVEPPPPRLKNKPQTEPAECVG